MPSDLAQRVDLLLAMQGQDPRESLLLGGELLAYDQWETKAAGGTFLAVFEDGTEGFHKRHDQLSTTNTYNFGHTLDTPPIHECAAWHFAKELGSDYEHLLPPTVYVKLNDEWGSLALRLPGAKPGTRAYLDDLGKAQVNDAGFFDLLIGQQDRHLGNFLWDAESRRLGLFDHGFSFPAARDEKDRVRSDQLVNQRRQKAVRITDAEIATMKRVLDSGDLLGIAPLLEPERAAAMTRRIERLLAADPCVVPRVRGTLA